MTKTAHKTLPGVVGQGGGVKEAVRNGVGSRVWWGGGLGVVGGDLRGWVSRCHSIDQLSKLWLLHCFE